jgi:putative AdoMet-dependent methyltransferase
MNNWNDIWNNNSDTNETDHNIINGFNHCENKIESENLFKYIIQICNIKKNEKILEFGCGSGRIGQYFVKGNYDYYGIDKSSNMIKKFVELLNYKKVEIIDGIILPYPDNHFDVVICYSVIQYLNDLDEFNKLLDEFIRVSKRIIYIGDLESVDHSKNNKKYYKKNNDFKHLIVKKEYFKLFNMKYEINFSDEYCSRNSRYNILINNIKKKY